MSSKHDVLTFVITSLLIVSGVVLVVTNHMDNSLMQIFGYVLPGIFGYWFGRGGNASATDALTGADSPSTPKAGVGNEGGIPGNGGN